MHSHTFLGLIWTLILHYQIGADSGAKNELLQWVRSKIPSYNIQNFTKDWNDGRALCALNNALAPGTCSDHERLDPNQKVKNCQNGTHPILLIRAYGYSQK